MITHVYSKVDPQLLLHVIYKEESREISSTKRNQALSKDEYPLQAIAIDMPSHIEVKPHMHTKQTRETHTTQEALVILSGSVELSIYDIDKSLVEKTILNKGDCYMIINGGHSLKTLSPARLFEFKNGPYLGAEKDKTFF